MKKQNLVLSAIAATVFLIPALGIAQVSCSGWRLVSQNSISVTERVCVYEKSGARISYVVQGFCPFNPPGCQ
jgi:hypothetical protein